MRCGVKTLRASSGLSALIQNLLLNSTLSVVKSLEAFSCLSEYE